ncbi:MAG: M1 family metallopeptidase [Actinomycetales bacterium]
MPFVRHVALVTGVAVVTAVLAPIAGYGRPGIGDGLYPKYGNGGYDVQHYDIAVSYAPATRRLTGTATVTAVAQKSLTRFDLDFVLTVRSVVVNGQAASYSQSLTTSPAGNHGGELIVRPARAVAKGSTMTVTVSYDGTPSTRRVGGFTPWVTTTTGAAALGEPESAAWWFPSNDHPRDKATYDVAMTVPAGLEAISNGVLQSHTTSGSMTTWSWRETRPMATYLAFAAMGDYALTTSTAGGLPFYVAVGTKVGKVGAAATADLDRTPEVLAWESTLFGPYPFDAMGGVVPDGDFGYALENQTKPVYTRSFWSGGSNMYVVVHENAHQWFGDSVSVDRWKDIWLNEGFATYAEWLWSEHVGQGTAQEILAAQYARSAADAFWTTKIGDPTEPQLFEDPVYDRGAMTLGALRTRIGDPEFFTLLTGWAAAQKDGTATTSQFVDLAEQVSGEDLTSFFDAWLFSAGKPAATPGNGLSATSMRAGRAPASMSAMEAAQSLLRGRLRG